MFGITAKNPWDSDNVSLLQKVLNIVYLFLSY